MIESGTNNLANQGKPKAGRFLEKTVLFLWLSGPWALARTLRAEQQHTERLQRENARLLADLDHAATAMAAIHRQSAPNKLAIPAGVPLK